MDVKTFNIVLVGPSRVGKTALIMNYVKSMFGDEYEPTLEDVYRKQFVIDEEACIMYIKDTCGGADYSSPMLEGQIRGADGYLCIFIRQ